MKTYTYYALHRPIDIGTCPKQGMISFENYDKRTVIEEIDTMAWGNVTYDRPLTQREMDDYSLTCVPIIQLLSIQVANDRVQHRGEHESDLCEQISYLVNENNHVTVTVIYCDDGMVHCMPIKYEGNLLPYCITEIQYQAIKQITKDYEHILKCDNAYDYLLYLADELIKAGNPYRKYSIDSVNENKVVMILTSTDTDKVVQEVILDMQCYSKFFTKCLPTIDIASVKDIKLLDSNMAYDVLDKLFYKIQQNDYVATQQMLDEAWEEWTNLPAVMIETPEMEEERE